MTEKEKQLNDFINSYWQYFLDLENEFANTQKYVAFDMCNKDTYSIEYLKLFQAVCSEIDVLGKEILHYFEPEFKADGMETIKHWGYGITQYLRESLSAPVLFAGKIRLDPWAKFGYEKYKVTDKNGQISTRYRMETGCVQPKWWREYNQVKHARTSCGDDGRVNYQRANFGNLIQAFAALYILEQFYMDVLIKEAKPYYPDRDCKLFFPYYDDEDHDVETEMSLAGAI